MGFGKGKKGFIFFLKSPKLGVLLFLYRGFLDSTLGFPKKPEPKVISKE
jgi:hypothetical protein